MRNDDTLGIPDKLMSYYFDFSHMLTKLTTVKFSSSMYGTFSVCIQVRSVEAHLTIGSYRHRMAYITYQKV